MLRLYITTRHRYKDPLSTVRYLPPSVSEKAVLVVDSDEEDEYRKIHPRNPILVFPARKGMSLGAKRQFVLDHHDIKKYGKGLMLLDDDLKFRQRRKDDTEYPGMFRYSHFRKTQEPVFLRAFERIERKLETHPMVGLPHEKMANNFHVHWDSQAKKYRLRWRHHIWEKLKWKENMRLICAVAVNVEFFRKHGVRYDRLQFRSDIDAELQVLRLGYPTAAYGYVTCGHQINKKGGANDFRTPQTTRETALALHKLHPKYVKVIEREGVALQGQRFVDVQMKWAKAFQDGTAWRFARRFPREAIRRFPRD